MSVYLFLFFESLHNVNLILFIGVYTAKNVNIFVLKNGEVCSKLPFLTRENNAFDAVDFHLLFSVSLGYFGKHLQIN